MTPARRIAGEPAFSVQELALRWLEHDQQQRFIINQSRRIIWANAAASAELRRERELQDIGGMLVAHDPANQLLLARFIAGCCAKLSSVALSAGNGDGHVLVRGREIAGGAVERYFALLMLRSGSEYEAEYADLASAFKLTQKEHQVLLQMVRGCSIDEVAASFDITVETVRSHTRQIYAKLGVHSREKLFWRVKPYGL